MGGRDHAADRNVGRVRQWQCGPLERHGRHEGAANGVIDRLAQEFSNDLRIRASIVRVEDGSLPRFELKSRRLRIIE